MNKTILALLMLTMTITLSCGSDEPSPNSPKDSIPNNPLRLNIDNSKDIRTIQVGDTITVNFEIEGITKSDTVYFITPETDNKVFHQTINEDFLLLDSNSKIVDAIEIKKGANSKGTFRIKVLEPGNFQHTYHLLIGTKQRDKRSSSEGVSIAFNAVKLSFITYSRKVRSGNVTRKSIHERYYKFTIDDGKERFDNYLTSSDTKTHTYLVEYAGASHTEDDGTITALQEREFRGRDRREGNAPRIPSRTVTSLQIEQKFKDGTKNNIVYKNIPIEEK